MSLLTFKGVSSSAKIYREFPWILRHRHVFGRQWWREIPQWTRVAESCQSPFM